MKIAALLLVLAQPVFADEADVSAPLPPRPVVSEIVNLNAGAQTSFAGVVSARASIDLGFSSSGTVVERPVDTGDLVAKGDVLARLDPEDLDADVRAAEAGVTVVTAQLRAAQDAQARASELLGRGVDSETILEDAERSLTAAQARLEQAQATLKQAEDLRSFASLTAPQDGVITQIYEQAGASVSAGQAVLRLAGTEAREITIDVTEQDAASLSFGTVFDAQLAANRDITAQASLTRIDPVAVASTRTRQVHLTLADAPVGFRLGALVNVSLSSASQLGMSLERAAVLDADGAPAIWIVDRATNAVRRVPVELGETFGARVQILDGLEAGDEVVTKGINSLEDGQLVGPRVPE